MTKKRAFKERLSVKIYEIPNLNRKLLDLRKSLMEVKKLLKS